jgi:ATP-dependent helicase/nuclease subunit A
MSDELARLDSLHTGRDILLQAPAGSGKTTVLAQRFLSALSVVDEPEQVLAITFTRKAAAEMRERVLLAIEGALPDAQADLPRWQELARAVHERARLAAGRAASAPAHPDHRLTGTRNCPCHAAAGSHVFQSQGH